MKVVVQTHSGEIGGSQLNAVDLAAAVRSLGHRVAIVSPRGDLIDKVRADDLPYMILPDGARRPSHHNAAFVRAAARRLDADVVHGYEWPPGLECWWSARGERGALCTVMSMSVAPFLPRSLPVVVGTPQIAASISARHDGVFVVEPPVDLTSNVADPVAAQSFRTELGIEGGDILIVVVGRIVQQLKLEGLLSAIRAVLHLARAHPVRLAIVGDGPDRHQVDAAASEANARADRRIIDVLGTLSDPRPAYGAADIMLGMGGSALRALAFGKPLVVQGERGFWRTLDTQSWPDFGWQGWYGLGDGTDGANRLSTLIEPLIQSAALRDELGAFGRRLIEEHFSLAAAARRQVDVYEQVTVRRPSVLRDFTPTAQGILTYKVQRRLMRLRGNAPRDDFNSTPVTTEPPSGWAPPVLAESKEIQ